MKDHTSKAMAAGERSGARIPAAPEREARVEVQFEGRCCRLPLLDISEGGLCFECPGGLPEIAPGSSFTDAVVRIADCEIQGHIVICHVTSSISTGTLCGARFRPTTEADQARLSRLVNQGRTRSPATGTESRSTPTRHDTRGTSAPKRGVPPPQCPHCRANLEHDEAIEGSICPYCLQELGTVAEENEAAGRN